jgi:crossover junction endodeoxyribonuclease RuvC
VIKDRIILGIDPGTNVMGFGLIHVTGNKIQLLELGTLHLNKIDDHGTKLKMIFDKVLSLIDQYHPDELAAEAPFFWKKCSVNAKIRKSPRCSFGCCSA